MKKSRFSEGQIIGILKQHEAGVKTAELCRERGISAPTFYQWKSKYGGLEVSEAQRLKAMEDENRRLKLLVAELILHGEALKAVIRKTAGACRAEDRGCVRLSGVPAE
jgi:putative transposase